MNALKSRTRRTKSDGDLKQKDPSLTHQKVEASNEVEEACIVPYDDNLLERTRTQWQFGDWESLTKIDRDTLQHHQDRAKLALLAAAGHLQQGNNDAAQKYVRLALEWGCNKKLVSQILIAGVHNSLGRAAAVLGQTKEAKGHIVAAITTGTPGTDIGLLVSARLGTQLGFTSEEKFEFRNLQRAYTHGPITTAGFRTALCDPLASKITSRKVDLAINGTADCSEVDAFYAAFEDRFRGSRELIKKRVGVYLPFAQALAEVYPSYKALDLGCGRGEWLELLQEQGIPAEGIDINLSMLRRGGLSLDVKNCEAVEYLESLPGESRTLITAIHLVEHLPFEELKRLVHHANRVLVPGGILIMETPNPENLTVGACKFYTDPTHKRPIPPSLLSFLAEYFGFVKFKIMRLQEPKSFASTDRVTLKDVIAGVSLDYAVVAQKAGVTEHSEIQQLLNKNYGLSLNELVEKYDAQG